LIGCVIVTHRQGEEAGRVASELIRQGAAPESVVIVHNPTGPDVPALTPPHEGVQVIRMQHNRGYAGGMNAGIERHLEAGATHVLLATHDVVLRPGALAALLDAANSRPGYGALGPALIDRRDGGVFSLGVRALPGGGLAHRRKLPREGNGTIDTDAIDGALMLVRADALRAVGLLDDRFFMYFEESDLLLRLRRAGWRVGVVLDAVAEQQSGMTSHPGAFGYLMARNGLEYARRCSGVAGIGMTLVRQLLDTAMVLAAPIRRRGGTIPRYERERLVGLWVGVAAFAARRWGPPPSFLAGLGEARGTRPWS
jgi:N-acetylglucosaminyl-diphospho-decaprenol L-rhamnosyltransferase